MYNAPKAIDSITKTIPKIIVHFFCFPSFVWALFFSKKLFVDEPVIVEEPAVETEPIVLNAQDANESVYQIQEEAVDFEIPYAPETASNQEFKGIDADSPYNIKDSIEYAGGLESSYLDESESIYQAPPSETPQVAQNELDVLEKEVLAQKNDNDFIYPDHSYEPQPTSARQELEDKYEKYLDDLYFDETDIPLGEQLAKDEEKYGFQLKRAYSKLPKEFEGYKRQAVSPAGGPRRGVIRSSDFYRRFTGVPGAPDNNLQWLYIPSDSLLEACNGEIWRDDLGEFSAVRNTIKSGYSEDIRLKKNCSPLRYGIASGWIQL